MDENDLNGNRLANTFSQKRCIAWFNEYATDDVIGPDGIERFCNDIAVPPEDVTMLVLAHQMHAQQMGFFTLTEWLDGLTALQCDSVVKLQLKINEMRLSLNEADFFKPIFRFAFTFAKEMDQRSLDIETAKAMLIVLFDNRWPLIHSFVEFLDQSTYKVINKDQWMNILEFARTQGNTFDDYDLDGAWPVLLDDFVLWTRSSCERG